MSEDFDDIFDAIEDDDISTKEEVNQNEVVGDVDDEVENNEPKEGEDVDDEVENNEPEEGEEVSITSLAGLAEAMELPIEEVLKLQHSFKANGEEMTHSISDMQSGYQSYLGNKAEGERNIARNRALNQRADRQAEEYEANAQVASQVMLEAENLVAAQLQSPQMAELYETDKSEYLIQQQVINQQLAGLQQRRETASAEYQQYMAGVTQQRYERNVEFLKSSVPDFGKEHTAKIYTALQEAGFESEEIKHLPDARVLLAALKYAEVSEELAQYKAKEVKGKKSVKRLKKKPQTLIKRKSATGITPARSKKAMTRFKKNPSDANAAAAIELLL